MDEILKLVDNPLYTHLASKMPAKMPNKKEQRASEVYGFGRWFIPSVFVVFVFVRPLNLFFFF